MRPSMTAVVVCVLCVLFPCEVNAGKGGVSQVSSKTNNKGDVFVRGHLRQDGTSVRSHMRSHPDGNVFNNWSTRGNVNPHTGKLGTLDPYRVIARSASNKQRDSQGVSNTALGHNENANKVAEHVDSNNLAISIKAMSDEAHADYILSMIMEMVAFKKHDAAVRRCKELVEKYPNTEAGIKAKSLLPTIND